MSEIESSLVTATEASSDCRRQGGDRRKRVVRSLFYGSVLQRRRSARRARDDSHFIADWHEPALLYTTLAILLLSALDALLTLNLLHIGASEANWFMDQLIKTDPRQFVAAKMALTGLGVIYLVVRSRFLLFGRYPVSRLLYLVAASYAVLIGWELTMLVRLW